MKQSHYWGASSRSASQDLPSQKTVTLNFVLSRMNQMNISRRNLEPYSLPSYRRSSQILTADTRTRKIKHEKVHIPLFLRVAVIPITVVPASTITATIVWQQSQGTDFKTLMIIHLIWVALELDSYQQRPTEKEEANALIMNSEKCVELALQAAREASAFSMHAECANYL